MSDDLEIWIRGILCTVFFIGAIFSFGVYDNYASGLWCLIAAYISCFLQITRT